jgi:Zn-dependent peptidase ImmA (M78 family)
MLYREQMAAIRAHQETWPVKPVPIAKALGLRVFRISGWPDTVSGLIRRDPEDGGDSGFAVYVNGRHAMVRQRFTIAHEIAHFVLHRELIGDGIVEDGLNRAEGLSNMVEAQANRFAARLLMPDHLIAAAQESGRVTIPQLADAFNVSRDAMSIRILGVPWRVARDGDGDRESMRAVVAAPSA